MVITSGKVKNHGCCTASPGEVCWPQPSQSSPKSTDAQCRSQAGNYIGRERMMDLVLMGGNVLTMDPRRTRAEAVAVEGGKIAAVGANAEIAHDIGPETIVVHLAGRTLLPGII